MIAVIADDLTGAAELGGVALRCSLAAEVQTRFSPQTDAAVVAIDTDTRSCTPEEAARRVASVAVQLRENAVEQVFKKVDSVLRGQVTAELTAMLETWGRPRALLVPANPGLGRVIRDGHYYVGGQPLHHTDFGRDPKYPAATSEVIGLLGSAGSQQVSVVRTRDRMPARGILVGEAASDSDLDTWASRLDTWTLPAGAAEFFGAFLKTVEPQSLESASCETRMLEDTRVLLVSGSALSYSGGFYDRCAEHGIPVLRMPTELFETAMTRCTGFQSSRLLQAWADAAVKALQIHPQVAVAIDQPLCRQTGLPQVLGRYLGELVAQVIHSWPLDHLFVEGGGTAAALVQQLGWTRLRVREELLPGVVSMQVDGISAPLLTIKPGSYAWPDKMWPPWGHPGAAKGT